MVMAEVLFKSLQLVLLGIIVFWLWRVGRKHGLTRQQGWRVIWLGFVIILFGSLVDIADTSAWLSQSSRVGAIFNLFLLKMLCYVAGSAWLAWGFWRWMPNIAELLQTHQQLCGEDSLFCNAPARASELQLMNTRLEEEIQRRKQAEVRFQQEKERQYVTLQAINDGLVTTDIDGHVDYINPAGESLTGWQNGSAIGQHYLVVCKRLDKYSSETLTDLLTLCLREGAAAHLDDAVLTHEDGQEFNINISLAPLRDSKGQTTGAALILNDLTEVMGIARQLGYQASHDMLTGLVNRREFERLLESAIRAVRNSDARYVMLYIDLDRFKLINDSCGHRAGDELLIGLAAQIKQQVPGPDIVARLGGDEFGVLLSDCSLSEAVAIAEKLQQMLREFHFSWQDKNFDIGASIGVVPIDKNMRRFTDVMTAADIACYVAKDLGRNRLHVYSTDDKEVEHHHGEMVWVHRITQAFEDGRFFLYAQPIVAQANWTGEPSHYEILIRMQSPEGELISPMSFIPGAETYNLMPTIDRWVLRTALGYLREAQGPADRPPINCTINLSGQSLNDEHFLAFVIEQFHELDVIPDCICFEITETAAISNLGRAMHFIERLRRIGCRFALDDFGAGVSSLTYLKNLNIDYLKIDGSFIRGLVHDVVDYTMVESINQIAHVMGLQTIAEFVESEAIIEALKNLQVDYLQGYAIGRPIPLQEVLAQVSRQQTAAAC